THYSTRTRRPRRSTPTRRSSDLPGRILIVTIKDISDVKQALRTRAEMLDFLSHDLRSPMISLLALAETMRQSPEGEALKGFLDRSEEHTSELQSREKLVCRLLLE